MSTAKINEQQKEWAIKGAAGIATFVFCYLAIIHPIFQEITISRQDVMDSQRRSGLYQEIRSLSESLEGKESDLATLAERTRLIGKISDIAGQTGLKIETLSPRTESDGAYVKLKIEMTGVGSFFELLKFLKAVEGIGVGIMVKDVSLLWKPSSEPHGRKKRFTLADRIRNSFKKTD